MRYPLAAPRPPRVADHLDAFARIEASGIYSNNGPELQRFEAAATEQLFGGVGACLGVGNATLGLMLAIKQAAGARPDARYAIVPALTFAATGQAAHWAGLTPLVADIDADGWSLCPHAVARLLARHGRAVAVVVPYAAYGDGIDVDFYTRLHERNGVGVVVDAASSLGWRDAGGRGLAADAPFATVHSMHATKTFAVAEGGLIHSSDRTVIDALRAMTNFGFEGRRSATLPGMNAKLSETTAVLASAKLAEIDTVVAGRAAVEEAYRTALVGFEVQHVRPGTRAVQFLPVLLPRGLAPRREAIAARMAADGVGTGTYFSPHLGEQPWFQAHAEIAATPVADDVAARIMSLPITDAMGVEDATIVAERFVAACAAETLRVPARPRDPVLRTLVIGGGPAGTAMLTAASKRGQLAALAEAGLAVVERDAAIGNGRLGRYAITSDSTAATFLTAVRDNPHPELAALARAPAGRAVSAYTDALGVPLVEVGPLLRATGEALAGIVTHHGGEILTRHEAVESRRTHDGHWRTTLRRLADGHLVERVSQNIVVATGGYQPADRTAVERVAGERLGELAGERLVRSDDVLTLGGFAQVAARLADRRAPRIAVIGGSTSALTTVALLLKGTPALPLGAGGITLLHRRPLRPFYPSVEAAHAEGFDDFGADDICPVSGFVYRLAGFRLEARELVLRMLGIAGRAPDPRVALHRIAGDDAIARQVVRDADLVIAALGYRPHAHRLLDQHGAPIVLASDDGDAMVDPHCRVRDVAGATVPGVYGIGLAAGFVPWGRLGGEPSFRGQANGLWLWQNDVGAMILDQMLDGVAELRAVA